MRGQTVFAPAGAIGGPLLSEILSAKEAKEADRLQWKSPRLSLRGREGIAVRTKWQFSHVIGDKAYKALKGNCHIGDDAVALWEIQLNLSRKFNLI